MISGNLSRRHRCPLLQKQLPRYAQKNHDHKSHNYLNRNIKIFILVAVGISVLTLPIFYLGYLHSFRNFAGGGKGYPLAVYSLHNDISGTNSIIDSLSKIGWYHIERRIRSTGESTNYLYIGSGSLNDTIIYEFECLPSIGNDSTSVFLWGIFGKSNSITPYSNHNNRSGFNEKKSNFEKVFVWKIKSI